MPLIKIKSGQEVILKEIKWSQGLKQKLQTMGLTPGTRICVVSSESKGPMLLEIRGSRLALGRGIVSKIDVDLI